MNSGPALLTIENYRQHENKQVDETSARKVKCIVCNELIDLSSLGNVLPEGSFIVQSPGSQRTQNPQSRGLGTTVDPDNCSLQRGCLHTEVEYSACSAVGNGGLVRIKIHAGPSTPSMLNMKRAAIELSIASGLG
jgi:hypothetical protein